MEVHQVGSKFRSLEGAELPDFVSRNVSPVIGQSEGKSPRTTELSTRNAENTRFCGFGESPDTSVLTHSPVSPVQLSAAVLTA